MRACGWGGAAAAPPPPRDRRRAAPSPLRGPRGGCEDEAPPPRARSWARAGYAPARAGACAPSSRVRCVIRLARWLRPFDVAASKRRGNSRPAFAELFGNEKGDRSVASPSSPIALLGHRDEARRAEARGERHLHRNLVLHVTPPLVGRAMITRRATKRKENRAISRLERRHRRRREARAAEQEERRLDARPDQERERQRPDAD